MEYLHGSSMSPANINYMTAIRSMCIMYGRDTIFMRDQWKPMFVKAYNYYLTI